ncbi:Pentatricopeptide repeat-containing protein [Platanthera zijinensis]|uniref:Pentatricopeptide repeat-containing protein n=1 Tax=Platanthera zijinensis TaxID=2320716 RepID=A0AAP0FUC0_9ASPA
MVGTGCRFIPIPFNLFPIPFRLRCLHRHLGFACHYPLDSDSSNSDELELELEHDFPFHPPENMFSPIVSRTGHPTHQSNTGNYSIKMKYPLDRKWRHEENLMKKITSALSKQGWDLSFHTSLGINSDSWCLPRMLNDLFDEYLDSSLVYFFFRKWLRYDDKWEHKLQIYCVMIHIAVSGNMNHIAMKLLREIVSSIDTVEGGPDFAFHALWQARRNGGELETVYSMLVICFAEQGMLDMATRLMPMMEDFGFYPSNGVYVAIAFLLKSQFTNKVGSDRDFFMQLQSCGSRLVGLTLSLFIREFCARGCLDSASKLLYDMPTLGGKPDTIAFTILIDAFCKRGCLKEATLLLFKMIQMGLSIDSTLISSLVHGYCKVGRSDAVMSLLNFSGCVLDAFMYNSFIFAFCQNGDVEFAHALLNVMIESDVVPDSINYTTVIKGYCGLYRLNYALKIFAQMRKRGIEPTIVTYAVLIEGHCKHDDVQGAEFVFNSLERDGLHADVATYNTLINVYSKKGHMHKAYGVVDMMKKAGVSPDSVTYNVILHGLLKRGFAVKTIFGELVRRGYSPDEVYSSDKIACTNIIHGYSKEGRLEEAYLIWCSMSKTGMSPDVVTCSALLNGFCKMHRMEDAEVLFHKMLDFGLEPDLILYNTLVRGFCKVGDVSKARQLLIMMKASGIFPNDITCCSLAIGLGKVGADDAQKSAKILIQKIFLTE